MALRKVTSPSRRPKSLSDGATTSENNVKKVLTEGEIQKLLREAQPGMGYDRLVKFTRLPEGGTAGIFESNTAERAIFAVDKDSHDVIWIEDIESSVKPPIVHAADVNGISNSENSNIDNAVASQVDSSPEEDRLHPIAKAYKLLAEAEQKLYWQNLSYLTVPYGPDRQITCKLIGFQNMDAGPIGGIFADEHNGRHLFCVSFKTGAPFRLGQPRPPRRP